jgi:lipopolysaccharide transport system ATP-binding protein
VSKAVIVASGIGKRYQILTRQREQYETLRDSLARTVKKGASALIRSVTTKPEPLSDFWALRNVSFELERGSVLGVIGRNGAGKSTLLKLLSRITEPTEGSIRLRGRAASLLEVGTGFHPELTGRENIFLNGAILGMKREEIKLKFDEIVDFAEVERFLDTPVKRYSSGMYVRLAFAVAASLEPEILIVDEVLAVGDAEFQRKCLGKMRDVSRDEGRTVLFVSHSMGAIRTLCTEAMWLDHGTVRHRGPVTETISAYFETATQASEEATDLAGIRRIWPGHGERIVIHGVLINDGRPVLFGESLSIAIDYEVRSDVDSVTFELGFTSIEGVRVITLDSDLADPARHLAGGTWGRVEAELTSVTLQPGRYGLDIAVRSGEHVGLDYLPACIWLQVLPGPNTPSPVFRESGGVRQSAAWRWNENDLSNPNRDNAPT